MLNVLRPLVTRVLRPLATALARTPVTPNALTVIGTVGVCAGALGLFPTGHLLIGTIVCTVFVLIDLLDGIADAAIFGGVCLWYVLGGHSALLAGLALYCVVAGGMVSYAKARAEGLGLRCDVGFAERSMRTLIGLVATGVAGLGVPYVLPAGLWVLAAASTFTFGQRVLAVWRAASSRAGAEGADGPDGPEGPEGQPRRAAGADPRPRPGGE